MTNQAPDPRTERHEGRILSSPEYTFVAFLEREDALAVDQYGIGLPASGVQQLPPHLTLLNRIVSQAPPSQLASLADQALKNSDGVPFYVRTNGLVFWYNDRYGGYTIAIAVEPSDELIALRAAIKRAMLPLVESRVRDWWGTYLPHVTIRLKVEGDTVATARRTIAPLSHGFELRDFRLLRHGGSFFGYEEIARYGEATL